MDVKLRPGTPEDGQPCGRAERTECALLRTQDADAPVPVRPKDVPACPPRA